ncbi:MAG: hypothetical protein V1684_01025 [bacterium]
MPTVRISQEMKAATYFLTIRIKNWYYILDRHNRWNIIANSLKFFQQNKGLKLYGFVFMINHLHLIVFSNDAIEFIRDFKKFTTRQILANIQQTEPALMKLFVNQDKQYELWGKTNMPEIIESEKFFLQKLNYIHDNPIKRDYVARQEDWYWSSANPRCELKTDNWS